MINSFISSFCFFFCLSDHGFKFPFLYFSVCFGNPFLLKNSLAYSK
nr:MAG TPA: hypothetical protein [Caudoviricetes sp.]